MKIRVKRVYDAPARDDGIRVLIDRIWPRGLSKDRAAVDLWAKELAPSTALRQWYRHDHRKWPEFRSRYHAELDANADGVEALIDSIGGDAITLLFGSREQRLNNAYALKEYLESRAAGS